MTAARPTPVRCAWSRAERAALAVALRPGGWTITGVSDAREQLGLPRLSAAPSGERTPSAVLAWLATPEARRAYAEAAKLRSAALEALAHHERADVARVRQQLGLRRGPDSWRLGEIVRAIVALRIAEIAGG